MLDYEFFSGTERYILLQLLKLNINVTSADKDRFSICHSRAVFFSLNK